MINVRERLNHMHKCPHMHCDTKEAFILITLLLLEMEGIIVDDWFGYSQGNMIILEGGYEDGWARDVITKALERLDQK